MDSQKKTHNFMESAAMKKMLNIAAKLYADSPQLYDKNKEQSYLLKTATKPDTSLHLPPIPGAEDPKHKAASQPKTPYYIFNEYDQLYKDYEAELKKSAELKSEKQTKLKKYIVKEQEYRERIEEYTKKIR
jgi:hypothetical protein